MHFGQIKRREFITLISGAAAWPLAARAQQPGTAVIGYLDTESLETRRATVAGIHRGLMESGYVEGHNLNVVYRWAENRLERLAGLAADLVGRQVAVIVAVPDASALAAKEATKSTPIVFLVGANPVDTGIVTTLNRPGGNLTGIYSLSIEMAANASSCCTNCCPRQHRWLISLIRPTKSLQTPKREKCRSPHVIAGCAW